MPEKNSQKPNLVLIILAAGVALISGAAGVALWKITQSGRPPATEALMVLPEPRAIDAFSLRSAQGQPFTLDDLRNRWTLIFFGFTHCPDVCPGTLYDLRLVHEGIGQGVGAAAPGHQVLFISVDPERDTPEKLGQYVEYFHPDFIGVTGSHEQLAPLTRQLGIAYRIEPHEQGQQQYGVDHSASVLLTDPTGRLYGVFPAPHDAERITADLVAILD